MRLTGVVISSMKTPGESGSAMERSPHF